MCEDDDDEKDDEGIIAVTDEPSLAFPLTALEPLFKIGRASCRERVFATV
jgi:hypothetical protein